jgi:hypothetical protein
VFISGTVPTGWLDSAIQRGWSEYEKFRTLCSCKPEQALRKTVYGRLVRVVPLYLSDVWRCVIRACEVWGVGATLLFLAKRLEGNEVSCWCRLYKRYLMFLDL